MIWIQVCRWIFIRRDWVTWFPHEPITVAEGAMSISLSSVCMSGENECGISAPYPLKIPGLCVRAGDSHEKIGFLLQKKEE